MKRKARKSAPGKSPLKDFDKANLLGSIIYADRLEKNMTQDQYGQIYSVTGPAIFKIEKGYVRPSLGLWLRIAAGTDLTSKRAVLLWLKSKLPKEYQDYVDLNPTASPKATKSGRVDYSRFDDPKQMREAVSKDKKLPKPMRDMLDNDDIWMSFKPTGHEINMLRDMFAPLGKGTKSSYREALLLLRAFTHSF